MKNSLPKWAALVAAIAVMVGLLPGCAWSIGGGKERATSTAAPTKGQELVDLKKARDQGAISEEEYQTQKKTIMAR